MGLIKKHRVYGRLKNGGSPAYMERAEKERLIRQNTALRERLDRITQGHEALAALERENRKLKAELRRERHYIDQTVQGLRRLANQVDKRGEQT